MTLQILEKSKSKQAAICFYVRCYEHGYKTGFQDGTLKGLQEGRQLGLIKGSEVGGEVSRVASQLTWFLVILLEFITDRGNIYLFYVVPPSSPFPT